MNQSILNYKFKIDYIVSILINYFSNFLDFLGEFSNLNNGFFNGIFLNQSCSQTRGQAFDVLNHSLSFINFSKQLATNE